jgi:hypothetical protein
MGQHTGDKPPSVSSQAEQVFPVNLGDQNPHGQLGLGAVLQTADKPVHVVVTVDEGLGI